MRWEPESSCFVEPQNGEEEEESSRVVVSCTFVNQPEKNRAKIQESRTGKKREKPRVVEKWRIDRAGEKWYVYIVIN